ncbi:MAG: hypothetical protein [Wendovervirus sonii]|uniref:DUF1566 domain-containing protein n=1 Tax=phage Lak_Megaphage_Sonny TaxID=3109229 RepID=A0ABZ0Z5K8_9CAUD|nr:MAG: hypothetical protein [phage Lak_Megaphage_Sonny]
MKHLYKKIYEAINTGIQKALVLDDEDDISMNYQHKKIVNNENLLPYYVNELLQDSDIEYNYEQIIKYYEETGYKYKVKDLNELRNIFDKIKDIENVSFEWISNMKDYISIILDDRSEINFYEETDKKPLFLKFANDDILGTENEILIYLYDEHYIPKNEYRWKSKCIRIQPKEYLINDENIANKNYSGYDNCLRIHDIVSKEPKKYIKTSAIDYCLNQKVNDYQGYLPSIGQLMVISKNIGMINYIFKYLNLKEITELNYDWWWSSTEYNNYNSWYMSYGNTNNYGRATNRLRIFPLFAIKKN